MNAAEANAVAEFLDLHHVYALSDADLLLTCLERAATVGMLISLQNLPNGRWVTAISIDPHPDREHKEFWSREESDGPTPLAAMIAAIVAYQKAQETKP